MLVRCRHSRCPATAAIFHMTPDPASAIFNAIVPAPFGALGIRTADAQVAELVYLPPAFAEKAPDNAVADAVVIGSRIIQEIESVPKEQAVDAIRTFTTTIRTALDAR